MNELTKIDEFFNKQNTNEIKNISLFKTTDGYELFYKYNISKIKEFYQVTYKYNYTVKNFSSLINAFSYCIFDHRNKINMANRVETLDEILKGVNFEIIRYNDLLASTKKVDDKLIYAAKLNECVYKKKRVKKEISKYVDESIKWQEKQLNIKNQFK